MKFIKAGEIADSNIFNKLDERKKSLLEGGMDVINLSIGTPDFQPGKHVMEAVSRAALDPDMYKYSLNETRELLDAVENWYKRRYDVTLADDEIMAVCGSQEGIAHVGFAFAGPNDLILAPDPGYPIFSFGPMMTGATVGLYPLYAEKNWQLDFNDIPEDVAERAKGLSFLSIPGAKEVGIEFNSLSKTYNLTGMRVSFALGNREVISRFRAFRSQIDYGMFYPIMAGAAAALNGPQDVVESNRTGYMARRDALCGGLRSIGWNVPDAQGTMFVWAKIPERFASSVDFAIELMEKTGVIVVPGSAFGAQGEGYVRMALVVPPERMAEAVRRIDESGIVKE